MVVGFLSAERARGPLRHLLVTLMPVVGLDLPSPAVVFLFALAPLLLVFSAPDATGSASGGPVE